MRFSKITQRGSLATFLLLMILAAWVLLTAASCSEGGVRLPRPKDRVSQEDFVAEVLAVRKIRDQEFRSREWSPLAVVAIASLDRDRTTIGSDQAADLYLPANDVAPIHAAILREPDRLRGPAFRLRAQGGKVWTDAEPPSEVTDLSLAAGTRVRISRFSIYWDNLETFGAVLRALDYTSPAFTHFEGLDYFPPDPAYRVQATVVPYAKAGRVMIADTHGWKRPAWRYGEAHFKLRGTDLRLVLLLFNPQPRPEETFFIAFTDQTRGKETYPAARYLEPRFVASGPLTLDFNQAINPSCAYNEGFACPLPPRENRLTVAIRAGEKIYPHAVGSPHK